MPLSPPSVRTALRNEARLLREAGHGHTAIARALEVPRSTVRLWTADIRAGVSRELLEARDRARRCANARRSQRACDRRLEWQEHGRTMARSGSPLHAAGCMLYWGEGSKSRRVAQITNSDPDLLRLFIRFLEECYSVRREAMVFRCTVYENQDAPAIERFWLNYLGLPPSSLRRSTISRRQADPSRRRELPYGTARLSVYSTQIVQSIYGSICHYAGITEPRWVGGPSEETTVSNVHEPLQLA
jgi:hypothetical protein